MTIAVEKLILRYKTMIFRTTKNIPTLKTIIKKDHIYENKISEGMDDEQVRVKLQCDINKCDNMKLTKYFTVIRNKHTRIKLK